MFRGLDCTGTQWGCNDISPEARRVEGLSFACTADLNAIRGEPRLITSELIESPGPAWEECEAELDARGTPLSLFHRADWARANQGSRGRFSFLAVREGNGSCCAGFAVESHPSRALPGHRLLSVRQLGVGIGGLTDDRIDAGLTALAANARADKAVLRVTVETFTFGPESAAQTSSALEKHGFVRVKAERTYERTLLLDLTPTEDEILAAFHPTARRHIRSVAKHPVTVKTAESTSAASSLQRLLHESLTRTGGTIPVNDWGSLIELSVKVPHLSRIAILERTDKTGPESILAFAHGCMHGHVAQYSQSGSTRGGDLKIPTTYALMWDLIRWARNNGARWFDFGGIASGTDETDQSIGGISDFKRYFSRREAAVGEQWQLEACTARAGAARLINRGVAILKSGINLLSRLKPSAGD